MKTVSIENDVWSTLMKIKIDEEKSSLSEVIKDLLLSKRCKGFDKCGVTNSVTCNSGGGVYCGKYTDLPKELELGLAAQ